jgi:D-serine deaminase-like pyridoxal phosphate-dependent protein
MAKKSATVLTLYQAFARNQVDTFKLLIELGARVDSSGVERKELHRFMDRIRRPEGD